MITFYSGTGSKEIQIVAQIPDSDWYAARVLVSRLLNAKYFCQEAADLCKYQFHLFSGTNWFNDEFLVLQVESDPETYVEIAEFASNPEVKLRFNRIAEAFEEIGKYVRFIIATIKENNEIAVETTDLKVSTETIDAVIQDAELLISSRGPISAVDRMHTGLHGFLEKICQIHKISIAPDSGITAIYKALRENHPLLMSISESSKRIIGALATVIDSINMVRNKESFAHPNENVIDEADAWLVINSIKTLLNYFNKKL